MSDTWPLRVGAAFDVYGGVLKLQNCIFKRVCFGCGWVEAISHYWGAKNRYFLVH